MKLSETQFKKQLDILKRQIIAQEPFEKNLAAFYQLLQKNNQERMIIRAFSLLRLFLSETDRAPLYQMELVHAFSACGYADKATQAQSRVRAPQAKELRPYTPLASLSKYARLPLTQPHSKPPCKKTKKQDLPINWTRGMEQLCQADWERTDYARQCKQIAKLPSEYRVILRRDFDELMLSHLFENHKSVIILSGSMLETLLIYRLKKLKIHHLSAQQPGRPVFKRILEANLNDLLACAEQNNLLPVNNLTLSRAARIYRNWVHPGLELAKKEALSANKAEICFLSVLEALDVLL